MSFLDRMERRFGWLAFPAFLRYYGILNALVIVLQFVRPDLGDLLDFDRQKILSGEVWRIVTMFFAQGSGRPSPATLILLIFVLNFFFMISDGLEQAWGTFRTSLFYYVNILCVLIASFLYPFQLPLAGATLYATAFLAFATLYPRVQILLMMIIPIEVRFLGFVTAGALVFSVIFNPVLLPFYLVAFLNYFIWVAIPFFRGRALVMQSGQRRKRFNSSKAPVGEPFHTCAFCDKTDLSDPSQEFRMGKDGREYCTEHVPD